MSGNRLLIAIVVAIAALAAPWVFYPEASNIVVFVIMAIVLAIRPAGLFGKEA
jgi:branched-subunit amino acid ABC-type transport system permease component